jgi:hypothetical protein
MYSNATASLWVLFFLLEKLLLKRELNAALSQWVTFIASLFSWDSAKMFGTSLYQITYKWVEPSNDRKARLWLF